MQIKTQFNLKMEEMNMKVKDLIEECKNRPTKKDCEVCPFTDKCNFLKGILSEMSPSEYETLMDKNI